MPLYPWRRKSIEYIPDFLTVTWTDQTACERFPDLAWVYDKLELSKKFCPSLTIDLTTQYPSKYPAVIKPKSKLIPQNKVAIVDSRRQLDQQFPDKTNYISQKTLDGEHISADYVIKDGKVLDKIRFLCHRDANNSFYLMERLPPSDFDLVEIGLRNLNLGNAVVNVETIQGVIVNIHLTPTIGIHDLTTFTAQLPHFLKTGEWKEVKYSKAFSRIYRRERDSYCKLIKPLPKYPEGIESATLCFDQGEKLSNYYQDESGFRYMIINGYDLSVIHRFAGEVYDCLEFKEVSESEQNQ